MGDERAGSNESSTISMSGAVTSAEGCGVALLSSTGETALVDFFSTILLTVDGAGVPSADAEGFFSMAALGRVPKGAMPSRTPPRISPCCANEGFCSTGGSNQERIKLLCPSVDTPLLLPAGEVERWRGLENRDDVRALGLVVDVVGAIVRSGAQPLCAPIANAPGQKLAANGYSRTISGCRHNQYAFFAQSARVTYNAPVSMRRSGSKGDACLIESATRLFVVVELGGGMGEKKENALLLSSKKCSEAPGKGQGALPRWPPRHDPLPTTLMYILLKSPQKSCHFFDAIAGLWHSIQFASTMTPS